MINATSIAKMKKGVRIINAARGELINEADLAAAIKSGHVAGAALDVFAEEPPKNCPLIGLPNVITTPHVAGSTAEAQEELGTQVAVQIRDYLVEGVIRNAVNLPALSPDQYRRVRPYLELAERLGSLVSQAAASRAPHAFASAMPAKWPRWERIFCAAPCSQACSMPFSTKR